MTPIRLSKSMVQPDSPRDSKLGRSRRDEIILDRYRLGAPVAEIAREAGVCMKTVRNVARRAGVPPRHGPQPLRDAEAQARYKAGEPVARIKEDLRIGRSHLRKLAARAGVPPRRGWQRLYPVDEAVFEEPTAVGWWLIGLLAADGSIFEQEHRVSLCQTVADADVLYAFLDYVGCPERPLTMLNLSSEAARRQLPRRPAAEARVFSARICDSLARHGIVPRKTASLTLSEEAARQPAVWLGVLDGDGCVGIYHDRTATRIEFSGSETLMAQCERFWRNALRYHGARPAARQHSRSLWTYRLHGAKAAAGAQILLAASPVSMRRKRRLLEQVAQRAERTSPRALENGPPSSNGGARKENYQWQE
jgi:hypothetical protein